MATELSVQCPFDLRQIEQAFAPVWGKQTLQVRDVFQGNINTIVKVESGGRCYGLRVRTQENVYRYEPDLVKEALVHWLIAHASPDIRDADIAAAFSRIRAARCGSIESHSGVLPKVLYYDWSRRQLTHPYCIYEWVEGEPLWRVRDERVYMLAGHTLRRIHSVKFAAFYVDFWSIGETPVRWTARFRAALDKEIHAAWSRLRGGIRDAVAALQVPSVLSCEPCLVHNDFSPANILVRDGGIAALIDWDNAVIDSPHLDFVKMKYWTVKDTNGALTHHPGCFAAFVDGYGPTGQKMVASLPFALYEALWLLRVFNFERSKDEQGLARTPGYPEAAVYEDSLKEVVGRLRSLLRDTV
jgi:aminoglycoside phosphotransferase (APT) family kinase protein